MNAGARLRRLLAPLLIFIAAFVVYQSNGDVYLYAYDSAPNSLLVFNALDNRRLDFDNFRNGYFEHFGAAYIFADSIDGRRVSLFPIGAALLSAPIYAVFDLERRELHQPRDITDIAFERYRLHYEKQAASIIAALAAVLLWLCARRIGTQLQAAVATLAFAFGSEMWTIGSQALWQHGPLNLVLLAMIYALLAAVDASEPIRMRWIFAAGVAAAFLPVVRPTALLFTAAALIYAAIVYRSRVWPMIAGIILGAAPGVLWNWHYFHSLTGGYAGNAQSYVYDAGFAAHALAGLLLSPSKGLFVVTPLTMVAIAGFVRAVRSTAPAAMLLVALSIAAAVLVVSYAFYSQWWGGANFGDRFLTDISAIVALLLVFVVPVNLDAIRRSPSAAAVSAVIAVLLVYSAGVQFAGADGDPLTQWSAVPFDVDTHNARFWDWSDSQIARDARATAHRFTAPPDAAERAQLATAATVTGLTSLRGGAPLQNVLPGEQIDVRAAVTDNADIALMGYTGGAWEGQSRVSILITGVPGAIETEGTLYLQRDVAPHGSGYALGTIAAPARPGLYTIVMRPLVNREESTSVTNAGTLHIPLTVR